MIRGREGREGGQGKGEREGKGSAGMVNGEKVGYDTIRYDRGV